MGKNVVETGICPLCGQPLKLEHPHAVDYNGHLVHPKCAARAEADQSSSGHNPNNSYT